MSEVCCPVDAIKAWWSNTPDLESQIPSTNIARGELKDPDKSIKSYTVVIQSVSVVNRTSSAVRKRYVLEFRTYSLEGKGGSVDQCLQDNMSSFSGCVKCPTYQNTTEANQANGFVRTSTTFNFYRTERKK